MKQSIAENRTKHLSYFDAPEEIKQLLNLAILNWENPQSQKYIQQALKLAPDSLDVAIAAYRYFFYKQQFPFALKAAETIVNRITKLENLPSDWKLLKPILLDRKNHNAFIRLYLNAYAGCGFVLAKLKQFDRAYQILSQVNEVDTLNEFGAKTMLDILKNPNDDEE